MNARRADAGHLRREVSDNWEWSDQFEGRLMTHCRQWVVDNAVNRASSLEDDRSHGVDGMIEFEKVKVAIRTRRSVANAYRDFTIRTKSSGAKTEIHKMLDGTFDATVYLYAWTDDCSVVYWILVDVRRMIECGVLYDWSTGVPIDRKQIGNIDGRTAFIAIPLDELKVSGCVLREMPPPKTIKTVTAYCDKCARQVKAYDIDCGHATRRDCWVHSNTETGGHFIDFVVWGKSQSRLFT